MNPLKPPLLHLVITCLALLTTVPVTHAEDLQDFLKRTGTGKATTNDIHENFRVSVFVGGQTVEMNRAECFKFWEAQKASKITLTIGGFSVLSKSETPSDDGNGAVISVVAKVSVTEDVRGSIVEIESTSHFIVLRDSNGTFRLLYAAIPKQVRHPQSGGARPER
jgi:hypothetical protein